MRHHLHHQPCLQVGHDHPQLCHALSVRGGREYNEKEFGLGKEGETMATTDSDKEIW